MCNNGLVSGLANITGGGILSNLERAIPDGLMAVLDKTQLPQIEVFQILNKFISTDEMFHTFNMGAGFCIIADSENVEAVMQIAQLYSPFILEKSSVQKIAWKVAMLQKQCLKTKRVLILASGDGSNFEAIVKYFQDKGLLVYDDAKTSLQKHIRCDVADKTSQHKVYIELN